MSRFGLIPTEVICRFGELTKTEIIVLSYLYSCRNKHTNQCNPRRTDIAKITQIHKSHISAAIKKLDQKGWVFVEGDGCNFALTIPNKRVADSATTELPNPLLKVTKSATTELPNPLLKVTKSATRVAKSATKSSEIGNSYIKDLNRQITDKEQTMEQRRAPEQITTVFNPNWKDPCDALIASFPNIQFTPAILGHIEVEVKDTPIDREAWNSTLTLYRRNYDPATRSYLPTKIGTVLQIFNEAKRKLEKNGNNSKSYQDQRADRAIREKEFTDKLRERVNARNRGIPRSPLSDSGRLLQPIEPNADGGRESEESGIVGTGTDGAYS